MLSKGCCYSMEMTPAFHHLLATPTHLPTTLQYSCLSSLLLSWINSRTQQKCSSAKNKCRIFSLLGNIFSDQLQGSICLSSPFSGRRIGFASSLGKPPAFTFTERTVLAEGLVPQGAVCLCP